MIDENFQDGDNQQSLVWYSEGKKDHHLCFWHLLHSQGILSKVINKLDWSVAVDCDTEAPDVSQTGTRGEKQQRGMDNAVKEERNFRLEIGGVLSGLTYQAMIEHRDRVCRTVNECRLLLIKEQDESVKKEHAIMEEEAKSDLQQIEAQMVEHETLHKLKKKPANHASNGK